MLLLQHVVSWCCQRLGWRWAILMFTFYLDQTICILTLTPKAMVMCFEISLAGLSHFFLIMIVFVRCIVLHLSQWQSPNCWFVLGLFFLISLSSDHQYLLICYLDYHHLLTTEVSLGNKSHLWTILYCPDLLLLAFILILQVCNQYSICQLKHHSQDIREYFQEACTILRNKYLTFSFSLPSLFLLR